MSAYATLKKLSPEEIRAEQKKLGKEVLTKIVVSVLVTVVSHLATGFIIDKLDGKKELTTDE